MRKKRNLKERVCAFVLALLLPLTSVLPDVTMVASAADPVNPSSTTVQNVSFYIYEGFTLDDGSTQEVGLSGAKITVYEDGTQIGETRATEKEGILILSDFTADSTKTYTYSVEKEGFDSETNIALDLTTQNKSELTMSPITLSKTAVGPLNPADSNNNTASIDINHRIENSSDGEPGYVWESNNKSVATVDDAGNIRAEGLGKTNITVTRHNETASVEVIVKETISGMTITANPGSNTTDNVDVSSVEISIGGMPSGAKGNVNIYKGDEKGTFIDTIQAPYDSSVAYNNPKGKTVFTAVFEENDKDFYLKSSVSTNEISYKKSSQIVLDQVSDTVTYGDAPKQITVTQASLQGRDLSYTSSNENVATVDENGSVSFKSAGTATITVTAAANDEYTESTAKYDITVDQKTLSNISLQNISWQPVEKVFDGTKEITMKGKLSHTENTDIVGDDVIEVEATAEVDSADAKSYTTCNITNITKSSDSRYDFSIDDTKKEVSSQIKITKRPVYVSIEKKTGDYETKIPYGMTKDEILTKVKADNKVVLAGTNGKIVDGAEQGMIGSDDSDLENRTEIILKDQKYYVGIYGDAIQPQVKSVDAGNYEIRVDTANINNYSGRLKITQEVVTDQNIWDQIQLDINNSQNVSVNNGVIWMSATGRGTFNIKAPSNYNKVNIKNSETDSQNNVLKINQDSIDENTIADVENEIYLSVEGQSNTRTTSSDKEENKNNKLPKGMIKVDNQLPKVVFENLGTAGLYSALQGEIVFTNFTKDAHIENIQVTDGNGSGIQEYAYSLLEIHSGEDVIQSIQNAAQSADTSWIPMSGTEINVPSSPEGYYVVLVKAEDKVGNTAVYSSNGLVVEIGQPNVELNITSKPTDRGVYSQDVEYELKVTDPGTIQSGIQKIEVLVESGNNKIEGDKATYTNSYTLENSDLNLLKKLDEGKNEYTFKELEEKSLYEFRGKLTAAQCNSNQVKITVTAYDWAGNVMKKDSNALQIDITSPVLTVSYDNNEPKENEYFSDSRTMTIVYRERNFQEDMAMFDVSIDGGKTVETKTLTELGSVEGIAVKLISDTQSEIPLEERTDDRLITYEIQFNGGSKMDIDYVIKLSAKDAAGNPNKDVIYQEGTVAKDTFTILKWNRYFQFL